ncbi:hypothetical protein [Actinoplanes sp. NPDC049802]|uniref:hypothetical protein n=1 Tax=Actinoplanes sp. NPDC049802 TaxID=3154742 RepID=UPI00340012DE
MSDLSGAFELRSVTPPTVEVDFGAGPHAMVASMTVLNLTGRVPVDGPVDFTALDAFPQSKNILWSGTDRGLGEALRTRPRIRFLEWRDPVGDIDLTGTAVGTLRVLGCGELRSLRLPVMETLLLSGPSRSLRVELPDAGYGLDLRLFPENPDVRVPEGLHRVRDLWLRVGAEVSASVLAALPELEKLRLDFEDPPGRLTEPGALAACPRLHTISLAGAYALGADDLPDLPGLRLLELHGVRRSLAKAVRDRYRGTAVRVHLEGKVSDAWLDRNLNNPFRNWREESEAAAEEAGLAYARARAAAEGVTPSTPDRLPRAERALRRFVADLNGIDQRYGVIETSEREEAWEVYRGLADLFHLPPGGEPSGWFDEDRTF